MSTVQKQVLIDTVKEALQYISYYHPEDYIKSLVKAYEREESPAAKNAMAQILKNSRMCALGKRPICQDTGIVVIFLEIGMRVRWDFEDSIEDVVNEGVRQAYRLPDNLLRASIVAEPAGRRINTKDNTPATIHMKLVPGEELHMHVAAKGGGSENKSKFAMLNPNDSVIDWVLEQVPKMGAGWCPPGMLGIGIGGSAEKAMLLAKESLMASIDMHALQEKSERTELENMRVELHDKINRLGIGAQGLGGLTTVLDVKIMDYPTHAASKPVAIIPNCAATRHVHRIIDASGAVKPLVAPDLSMWPEIPDDPNQQPLSVDLDTLQKNDIKKWQPGQTLLLSGTLLTGRDAAHKRIQTMLAADEKLPVDFTGKLIYYVGPVDPVRDEVVGPAGPTTASRMDGFTEMMLDKTGLLGMIGKAERGQVAIDSIRVHESCYLIAVGGAAYLVSQAIKASKVVAFADLGMEAIHEFVVKDMPVTVAVDALGQSVHQTAPVVWRERIKNSS